MARIEMFTWGYYGWGSETKKLVQAVDAAEAERGFAPPVFVDIRISRKVRAVGFRENAFGKLLGSERYLWMRDLGNDAILDGGKMRIHDRAAAGRLLDLALEANRRRTRVIFFCSCAQLAGCHRKAVADLLLKEAGRRGVAVVLDEWPGGAPRVHEVKVTTDRFRQLFRGRASIPFARVAKLAEIAGLPIGSAVRVTAPGEACYFTTGPAIVQGGKWALPVFSTPVATAEDAIAIGKELRSDEGYGPGTPKIAAR